ncbi:hypothetical protein A33Q_2572 [Indibacter alkaliphilus LW1]|jgi:hypothetical protein|uniref:Membrane or secreted protein n=1 Tax=Indibacter alkaliphilus (strain CCUG 57479 / KCTC 22604 / LW1) TaxID=1189612 RepID=S2DAP0_INDAL|nr:hypothetical protein [Indibacter alkaliphilus]EOZ95979.1 hypothetical protein A33Q_2572 [Indibacter alkaliphilus LW1]
MKKILFLPLLFITGFLFAQNIEGAWKMTHQNGQAMSEQEYVKIYQDGYFAFGAKEIGSNKFISAGGGEFSLKGNEYHETLDFFTPKPEYVGNTTKFNMDLAGGRMVISAELEGQTLVEIWEKIGEREDELTNNWVFTGRQSDGEISRSTPGDRRTVKILSGGRFQWIAFNSATKEFMGTGGGTYTAEDGAYTEYIEFFSRDDSRVGASLGFTYRVIDGEWHHSGVSSTGNPIYEIWSRYKDAYKP